MTGIHVSRYDKLWDHTVMRIENAENKAKNYQDFTKKMVTRLKRIKHEEKIHYAIAVLKEKGYDEVVDIYEGRLVMDKLSKSGGIFNV
ncbi:MAG: hypothetical protein ACOC2W_01960 [bacterium]